MGRCRVARTLLDSVRAARQLAGPGGATSAFAVWGHSQGGHAALFTGILARGYAPDLTLVGVAAAAPATELATLMMADLDTSGGENLTAMTLWSWSQVYGAPTTKVVTPEALPVIDELANECIETIFDVLERRVEGSRPQLPLGERPRRPRALAVAARPQHARHASAAHPGLLSAGRRRHPRIAAGHAGLPLAAVPGRQPRRVRPCAGRRTSLHCQGCGTGSSGLDR